MPDDFFYTASIEGIFQRFQTSRLGLLEKEAKARLVKWGKNLIEEEKRSVLSIFIRQFKSWLILILFLASFISVFLGQWTDFVVINCIILINGLVGFWQEMKAETSIAALKKMTQSRNTVMRDGVLMSIVSSELVCGDYIVFHEGAIVTCDVRLVKDSGLMVDESSLTGESFPVTKDALASVPKGAMPFAWQNMVLAGTTVVRGTAEGVVVATGSHTYFASIAKKALSDAPITPLAKALKFFSSRYVLLLGLIFSFLALVGFYQGRTVLDLGYILLAGLVSAVPEGLPIVITLVMVIGALSLSKKKTLIRYLPSVETLGSVTVIAADKTGTITEGDLIVQETVLIDEQEAKNIASLCNDATQKTGDPLDVALARWVGDYQERKGTHKRLYSYSFDARLRFMATVNHFHGKEKLFIKGAYEVLREKAHNKESLPLFDKAYERLLSSGLRVIALGSSDWNKEKEHHLWKIKIVGLIGFLDPPKEEVKEAVIAAKKAGVHVIMITGDHPMTAKAIAKEVEIFSDQNQILEGHAIDRLSDIELSKALHKTTVLARILPEHKLRIVQVLQQSSAIVAVTGDGVNDVPALRAADIGIAMGSGTEAAKSVSEMIILDNNLKVIVEAIKNARVIADNIRKVIYYLLSTSLMEIALVTLAIALYLPLPLFAIQILWINIVTDGVLDKFFPFAKEEGDVMKRAPKKPKKQFLDQEQIINVICFGFIMGLAAFGLFFYLNGIYSKEKVSTIVFTSVVFAQWANGIQAQRANEPFFLSVSEAIKINPYIFIGLGLGIFLQMIPVYIIPHAFHSTPLTWHDWYYPVGFFLLSFFVVEMRKIIWKIMR
jgi:Ca2+-transporting ATPase